MERDKVDRRRLVRIKMPFTIHLNFKDKEPISTYTEDISEEGVRVVTKKKLDTSDTGKIEIYIAPIPLACRGKVIWVNKKESEFFKKSQFYEAGINLIIGADGRQELKEVLRDIR